MKLRFIDLFGAPGGMSLGMKMAGLQPIAVLDNFEEGLKTYGKNFPEVPEQNIVNADASKKDIVEIFQSKTGLRPSDVDVIVGGPPCQGFSNVGRVLISKLIKNGKRSGRKSTPRFIQDERNNLYETFVKFVKYYRPQSIVMENVPGMLSYRNGWAVEQIMQDFADVGYPNISYKILNAADYGAPQIRKRIFFIATKKNNIKSILPPPTHFVNSGLDRKHLDAGSPYYVTVMEAIGDLPHLSIPEKAKKIKEAIMEYKTDPTCDFQTWARKNSGKVDNNITRWHRDMDKEIFAKMKPGDKWADLSARDRKRIGYNDDSFNDKWKRLPRNKPSHTIVAHLQKDGYMFIHPTQDRTISVREAARLQSFPDNFIFCGGRGSQFRQVGNAVPPLLARAVGKTVLRILQS